MWVMIQLFAQITSTILLIKLANSLKNPAVSCGMHFFLIPVQQDAFVEIIRR